MRLMRRHDDRELVAAEPRDTEVAAGERRQPFRDPLQDHVAGGVAERVVHVLEQIDVDQHQGHFVAGPRVLHHGREGFGEGQAVRRAVRASRRASLFSR